jgi:hypothetical protein
MDMYSASQPTSNQQPATSNQQPATSLSYLPAISRLASVNNAQRLFS